jgi:3-hydroxymyristoyl/3-hydroxydecanoyl-(acyl carrier protein) dehydratase
MKKEQRGNIPSGKMNIEFIVGPFLFVDRFPEGDYPGKMNIFITDYPVTPGVILTEAMAQIGLVGLGIFLTKAYESKKAQKFVFTSSEVEYLKEVLPGEKVKVVSEKIYFRLGKLKCKVEMWNEKGERVAKGNLAGMILKEG